MNGVVKQYLRRIRGFLHDSLEPRQLNKPPYRLRHIIGQDELFDGTEMASKLISLTGLKPDGSMLDLGCGLGRVAFPLLSYLTMGKYEGIDIVKEFTDWTTETITSKHPNFRFQHADIYNKSYNPNGKLKASSYIFPFPNQTFDLVVLYSVFTHMLPVDVQHYLSEINRVLKQDGPCLFTVYLHDSLENCKCENPEIPENRVSYNEKYLLQILHENSLHATFKEDDIQTTFLTRKEKA